MTPQDAVWSAGEWWPKRIVAADAGRAPCLFSIAFGPARLHCAFGRMTRLVIFNVLALIAFAAARFIVAGLPGKPLDAVAEPHPAIYAVVVIASMFLSFYIASFLAMRRRFRDLRRAAAVSFLPALCSVLLSFLLIYLVIAMNLVSVN
jgi:hypothetical protein